MSGSACVIFSPQNLQKQPNSNKKPPKPFLFQQFFTLWCQLQMPECSPVGIFLAKYIFRVIFDFYAISSLLWVFCSAGVGEVHVIGKVGVEKGYGKEQGGCVKVEGWGLEANEFLVFDPVASKGARCAKAEFLLWTLILQHLLPVKHFKPLSAHRIFHKPTNNLQKVRLA